jgi:acetyl-CoA synthetase
MVSTCLLKLDVTSTNSSILLDKFIKPSGYIRFFCNNSARIGAMHSVVFGGFSAEAVRDRIRDCNSKFVFVADEGRRSGKVVKMKSAVDTAITGLEKPEEMTVFVVKHTGGDVAMTPKVDHWVHELTPAMRPYSVAEPMASEDPLFVLYTSGSTGKPKGVVHTTAGYLVNAAMTTKWTFDLKEKDVYCSAADCGWITGHTYVVYGPLINGGTTVMFESIPTYPDAYRYWDMIQRHKITQVTSHFKSLSLSLSPVQIA